MIEQLKCLFPSENAIFKTSSAGFGKRLIWRISLKLFSTTGTVESLPTYTSSIK